MYDIQRVISLAGDKIDIRGFGDSAAV